MAAAGACSCRLAQRAAAQRSDDRLSARLAHGRVFVELFCDGRIAVKPGRDKLDADEVRWLDENALPQLERVWQVENFDEEGKAWAKKFDNTLPSYLSYKRAKERGEEW